MRMRIQREELHEIEKHFSGFDQNSFENLLKEQNLLASKLYKLSYTQILSDLENRNPHSEFLFCCISQCSSQGTGWTGTYYQKTKSSYHLLSNKNCSHLAFGMVCSIPYHIGRFKSSCKQVRQFL